VLVDTLFGLSAGRWSTASSRLRVAKNASASALSNDEPMRPLERRTPWRWQASAKPALPYWAPRSLWKITPWTPATAGGDGRVERVNDEVGTHVVFNDQPISRRVAMSMTVAR